MTEIKRGAYGSVSGLIAGMLGGLVAGFLFTLALMVYSSIGTEVYTISAVMFFLLLGSLVRVIVGGLIGIIIGAVSSPSSLYLLKFTPVIGGILTLIPSFFFLYLISSRLLGGLMIYTALIAGIVGGKVAYHVYISIFLKLRP